MSNQNPTSANTATPNTATPNTAAQRTRCEVWTRVMGYHRPVQNFNIGKKAEHYSRKHFSEVITSNTRFNQQFQ